MSVRDDAWADYLLQIELEAKAITNSEPIRPSDWELEILERFGAEYDCGTFILDAGTYWRSYIPDPIGFHAQSNDLTRDEYIEWRATGGHPLCGATTKAGTLCKNPVYGSRHYELTHNAERWKAEHRAGYCYIHGGHLD